MADLRDANLPRDLEPVGRLWLDYLTWGNDELESRYGFRLPVREAVERDLATIAKFQPPDGRLLLAFEDDVAVGTACMRRIGPTPPRSSAYTSSRPIAAPAWVARCSTS